MDIFLQIAKQNQSEAWEIIKKLDIEKVWKSIGAEINLVGSLKSGLYKVTPSLRKSDRGV